MFCNSRIVKTAALFAATTASVGWVSVRAQNSITANKPTPALSILDSTKEQDGLVGSVRRVKVESAKIDIQDGSEVQGPRRLLELTTYGIKGNRIENTTYPNGESPIGREEYKYDDRGNIIEMTLRDERGGILNREAYNYEFDNFGNWTKMVTSIVLFESGKLKLEPIEVTFRTLSYYFDDNIAKIVDKPAPALMPAVPQPNGADSATLQNLGPGPSVTSVQEEGVPTVAAAGEPPPPLVKRITQPESSLRTEPIATSSPVVPLAANKSEDMSGSNSSARSASEPATRENPAVVRSEASGVRINPVTLVTTPGAASPSISQKTAYQYYESGLGHFQLGDMQAAVDDYLQSIKLEPRSAEVYFNLGHAYLKLDKPKDAANAFKQSVKLNPDKAEAHYGLGLSTFRLNRFREAVNSFKQAVALDPKMAKAHFCLGLAYQELGEHAFVVDEYRILERLDLSLAKRLAQSFQNVETTCAATKLCH